MNLRSQTILLQPIGKVKGDILKSLQHDLTGIFSPWGFNFEQAQNSLPVKESEYNHERDQYNASLILRRVMKNIQKNDLLRVLGIIDEDIFSGNLNFVFGIAQIPKFRNLDALFGCLISITRLRREFYGRQANIKLFKERTLKEAMHELGHTFGLKHCHNVCVMRFSNSLQETDDKPSNFCKECQKQIESHF